MKRKMTGFIITLCFLGAGWCFGNDPQTTQRLAAWAAKVQSMGVTIKQMYWTLGEYDQVCIFEAPDDETAASVLLAADMLGNIRTQTMRAFTAAEMDKILAKVP